MSDGKYSVDDILNEYSDDESGKSAGADSDINIDDLIGGFASGDMDSVKNSVNEAAYRSEEAFGSDFDELPEAHDACGGVSGSINGLNNKDSTVPDDSFSSKYDKLFSAVTAVKERENDVPYTPAPKPDRSFSEKFEEPDLYGDSEEGDEEEKAGIVSLFKRKEGAKAVSRKSFPEQGNKGQEAP